MGTLTDTDIAAAFLVEHERHKAAIADSRQAMFTAVVEQLLAASPGLHDLFTTTQAQRDAHASISTGLGTVHVVVGLWSKPKDGIGRDDRRYFEGRSHLRIVGVFPVDEPAKWAASVEEIVPRKRGVTPDDAFLSTSPDGNDTPTCSSIADAIDHLLELLTNTTRPAFDAVRAAHDAYAPARTEDLP